MLKNTFLYGILLVSSLFILNINCQCSPSFELNVDFKENDLLPTPLFTGDVDLCCAACRSHTLCQAWTYVPTSQACWLKNTTNITRTISSGRNNKPFLYNINIFCNKFFFYFISLFRLFRNFTKSSSSNCNGCSIEYNCRISHYSYYYRTTYYTYYFRTDYNTYYYGTDYNTNHYCNYYTKYYYYSCSNYNNYHVSFVKMSSYLIIYLFLKN